MRIFSQCLLGLALLLSCSTTTLSYAQGDAPAYARQRAGTRGGGWNGDFREGRHYGGRYRGYYPYQPVIAGSWYTRPYPYHFDYYRQRYSAPDIRGTAQPRDCPCAEVPMPY